ncbi:MAG: hypothetical protein ACXWKT_18825 [Caulobacteraceae bacterium]
MTNLISHVDLPAPLRSLSPRYVERLANAGQLGRIRPIRLTPRSGAFYDRAAVEEFFSQAVQGAPDQ